MISTKDPNYPHNALHIFPKREDVSSHNTLMIGKQTETKYEVKSVTKVPKVVKCQQAYWRVAS